VNAVIELARALDFAARRHAAQRRKGAKAEPYINHLAEVALLLAEASDGGDPALVMAGLLHDTIEDTGTTREELSSAFGEDVAALVGEVTDDRRLDRETRKALQVQTAGHKSRRARMIKIADKTSNLRSVAESPPVTWTAGRKAQYIEWSRKVVEACGETNARLQQLFAEAVARALAG
jgi:GTP diphosphokinase / guanosine-3',5'-bis(diphosphate) 3'-diphosphatase